MLIIMVIIINKHIDKKDCWRHLVSRKQFKNFYLFLIVILVYYILYCQTDLVVITFSGIACRPHAELGAQTVHRQFGLRDGRFTAAQLELLFSDSNDDYYSPR